MIRVAQKGFPKGILEARDINQAQFEAHIDGRVYLESRSFLTFSVQRKIAEKPSSATSAETAAMSGASGRSSMTFGDFARTTS